MALIWILLALRVVPTLQFTHYANENATAVVSSVNPCHLYGDSDSYGIGVRISLYLQFFAGMLVQIADLQNELKSIRLGFNIVATATMINTYVGTHQGSFAYLEWYLVSALVLTLPLFVVTPLGTMFSTIPTMLYHLKPTFAWPNNGNNATTTENLGLGELVQHGDVAAPNRKRDADNDSQIDQEILKPWKEDPLGIGWSMLLLSFFAGTQVWLYFYGLNRGHRPECTAKVFIYANVNMYNHHWVTFLKVIAVFGATGAPVTLIAAVVLISIGIVRSMEGKEDAKGTQTEKVSVVKEDLVVHSAIPPEVGVRTATATTNEGDIHGRNSNIGVLRGKPKTEADRENILAELALIAEEIKIKYVLTWLRRLFSILQGSFGAAVAIVCIEKTIAINHIDLSASPIYSSGQFSALLVGIFTALPAAWKSIWKLIRERDELKKKAISVYRQQQFEKEEQERIRKEKESQERERLEVERNANPTDNQPIVITQSPWTRPLTTFANRMPNWRRSAQVNPESRAEEGLDASALHGQDRRQEP